MNLNSVRINNYRSIAYATFSLDPRCRVLVGINESGKSNLLKALSLLNQNINPVRTQDLRDALPNENNIKESKVMFIFDLERNEINEIINNTLLKVLFIGESHIVTDGTNKLTLKGFCQELRQGLYCIDIIDEIKYATYWEFPKKYKLIGQWSKPSENCPDDYKVKTGSEEKNLKEYKLVQSDLCKDVPPEYLENAEIDDLNSIVGRYTKDIVNNNLPKVLFWEYNEENLLPSSINIAEFSENPSICPPLKNMFYLAGIKNIKESVEEKREGTDNQFQNYLDNIATKTTSHFKSVWKEYKNVKFSLRLNGQLINPGIKEKNTHDFSRRSDGFKRFITFLLMISVVVKTDDLNNTLLLIDEPDTGLHPTGSRYLRDELIRISRNNYVVYSTHSIFMIDTGQISRHYIVKKTNEITTIEQVGESNIADEEVIYNALGFSIFSLIKEKNIIFEGWNDKHLFITFINNNAKLKSKFKDVGFCHAKGAKNIKAITPMIELANRKCIIISDSDSPALDEQKAYENAKGFGEWLTYQDINPDLQAITGEDFVTNEHVLDCIKKSVNELKTNIDIKLPTKKGKVEAIKTWLISKGLSPIQAQSKTKEIKQLISQTLSAQNIDENYIKLVRALNI